MPPAFAVVRDGLTGRSFVGTLRLYLAGTASVAPLAVVIAWTDGADSAFTATPLLVSTWVAATYLVAYSSASARGFTVAIEALVASLVLVMLAPAMLLISLLIKIESRGPVFFRNERIGRSGRMFATWRFRTLHMHGLDRERVVWGPPIPLFKLSNDPRVTRVGRFLRKYSLDELPQLFSVVTGDMSLVGPRPLTRWEVDRSLASPPQVRPGIFSTKGVFGTDVELERTLRRADIPSRTTFDQSADPDGRTGLDGVVTLLRFLWMSLRGRGRESFELQMNAREWALVFENLAQHSDQP